MKKTELEIRGELTELAETLFGKPRAAELHTDIKQLAAELLKISSFELTVHDEP